MEICEIDEPEILVVEDREALAKELASRITAAGVRAQEAITSTSALNIANDHIAVALIDLRLPETDGIEVACKIQRRFQGIEIVFYSAYPTEEYKYRAAAEGLRVDRWLEKGDSIDEAVHAVVEIHQRQTLREHLRVTIEQRLKSAAERLNLSAEKISDLLQTINVGSLLVPRGTGVPILPKEESPSSRATAHSFNDVLELITINLDEAMAGFSDPAIREISWRNIEDLVTKQLWDAVASVNNKHVQQLAIQLEHVVLRIESPSLTLKQLQAAYLNISLMRSSRVQQSDVSMCKATWRAANVEVLPSFTDLLKDWESLYGEDDDAKES
jgi:CheY-like chemotaxis protein